MGIFKEREIPMSNIDELREIFVSETKPVTFNYSRARKLALELAVQVEGLVKVIHSFEADWEDLEVAGKGIERLQADYAALAKTLRGRCEYCVNFGTDYYDQPCSDCVELDDDSHFEFVFEPARFAGEEGGEDA